jgi:hypothetical protein
VISSKSDPQELPPLEAVGCRPADVHKQAVDGRANPPVNLVVQLDGCWDCCKDPYILQPHCLGASGPRDCREPWMISFGHFPPVLSRRRCLQTLSAPCTARSAGDGNADLRPLSAAQLSVKRPIRTSLVGEVAEAAGGAAQVLQAAADPSVGPLLAPGRSK